MSSSSKRRLERPGRVASPDGKLCFMLQKTGTGVHVERRQQVTQGIQTSIVSIQTLFTTGDEFARFCEADALRFEYPLLYTQAKREFSELIAPLR